MLSYGDRIFSFDDSIKSKALNSLFNLISSYTFPLTKNMDGGKRSIITMPGDGLCIKLL